MEVNAKICVTHLIYDVSNPGEPRFCRVTEDFLFEWDGPEDGIASMTVTWLKRIPLKRMPWPMEIIATDERRGRVAVRRMFQSASGGDAQPAPRLPEA